MILTALILAVVVGLIIDILRTRDVAGARWEWAAVAGVTLAAVALRAVYLSQSSLEHLEVTYLFESIKPESLWGVITGRQAAEQMHQPLFDLVLRGWAGQSLDEAWLRTPSLMFTCLCIPVVWTLVRDELGPAPALQAAALTAVAPLLVWYGRDCTPYGLLALMSLGAMASARQALATPSRWRSVRTGILLALSFYTHFHGGWIAITVGLWMLRERDKRQALREVVATTAVLCLPWIPALLDKLLISVHGLREDAPLMRYSHDLTEATSEAFRVLLGGPSPLWGITLALVVAGVIYLWRADHRRLAWLVISASLIGLVAELHITWQLGQSKGIVYVDVRHYLTLAPVLLLAVAALPKHVATAVAMALCLMTSVPMVTSLEKPDVQAAAAYVKKYATTPEHGVGFLPAPWYEPILERYLLADDGVCPGLTHGRSREGWWRWDNCFFSEEPILGGVYGFPPSPKRLHQASGRAQLTYLWVVDIRDHRFGLPVPPMVPQDQTRCWKAAQSAVLQTKEFGPWVTVTLYDARKLYAAGAPPEIDTAVRTVTSAEAWARECE